MSCMICYVCLQNHYYQCPRMLVPCPHRCDVGKVAREELDKHVTELCPSLSLSCPFKHAGCKHVVCTARCPSYSLFCLSGLCSDV